jgi:hypothetical protein
MGKERKAKSRGTIPGKKEIASTGLDVQKEGKNRIPVDS